MVSSDTTVQDLVLSELRWDPVVDAADVGVGVHNGVVTLGGHVDTYAEKDAAEKVTLRVCGVRGVANDIVVRIPRRDRRDDSVIAEDIVRVLALNVNIPKDSVQILVRNGWVVLEGTVDWDYQRRVASRVAREVRGVSGVSTLIKLREVAQPAEIEKEIKAAITRQAQLDTDSIRVSVQGTTATLSGHVSSWGEATVARRAAAAAPGIHEVKMELVVEPARVKATI